MIVDLNNLSNEVLFYSNDEFYQFIENCLGVDEMILLKLQSIKNVRTLIHVPNVFSILSINCKELRELKTRLCFIDEDDKMNIIIKSGIKAGFDDLIAVLKEKTNKNNKRAKRTQSSSVPIYPATNDTPSNQSLLNASSLDASDSSSISTLATTPKPQSIDDYVQLIMESVEKFSYCTLKNNLLKNNSDYSICLNSLNGRVDGYIKCGCRTKIKIAFRPNTNYFQLSPFFKHLKNTRCSMMKSKRQMVHKNLDTTIHSIHNTTADNDCSTFDDNNDDINEEQVNNKPENIQIITHTSSSNLVDSSAMKRSNPNSLSNIAKKTRKT